ncbi:MAG: dihydrolipoyl dehydrogenase, partial [Candidatus Omnitrophica bacterium]|nr:dihydrolipoyl dehydrogenase [Candidatus Omnitrophota bacterium]
AISEVDGFVKIVFDASNDEVLGAQMIGPHVTEIIATIGVAVKNKLKKESLKETIFAHPTLSEIISEACEI